jgi:hypothetical protein
MPSFPPRVDQARIAELVRAYVAAEYRWELAGDWRNLRIGEPAPELVMEFPDVRHFGLLSAWDPYSIPRPEPVNRKADDLLEKDILNSGLPFRAAFSSAPNRTWREPSWLVMDMPVEDFDALSRRYGQLATLYWAASEDVRLRVDAAKPAGYGPDDAIDWLRADARD